MLVTHLEIPVPNRGVNTLNKKIIFIVGGLVLAGSVAGGAYSLGMINIGETPVTETVEEPVVEVAAAMFHNLPPLVVSANYNGSLRYLQVKMSIMTRNEETKAKLLDNEPLIQNAMIMLLDSYSFHQLENPEGKEELRAKAEAEVRRLIADERVESVLFTGFVIQ